MVMLFNVPVFLRLTREDKVVSSPYCTFLYVLMVQTLFLVTLDQQLGYKEHHKFIVWV